MTLLSKTSVRLRRPRGHIQVVVASTVFGAIAVATVSYLLWPTWTAAGVGDPGRLPISVGSTLFNVPTPGVRMTVQRRSGPQDRIDLAFSYPSLAPGIEARRVSIETVERTPPTADVIFLSIAAHGDALAPEERARTIFPRYLDATAASTEDGLTKRAFRDGSPYANEDLFVGLSPGLVARCTRDGITPGMCLSERRIEGADLTFRFPRAWLGDWRSVADAMQRIVDDIYKPHA